MSSTVRERNGADAAVLSAMVWTAAPATGTAPLSPCEPSVKAVTNPVPRRAVFRCVRVLADREAPTIRIATADEKAGDRDPA